MLLEQVLFVLLTARRQLQVVHVVLDRVVRRMTLGRTNRLWVLTRPIVRVRPILLDFGLVSQLTRFDVVTDVAVSIASGSRVIRDSAVRRQGWQWRGHRRGTLRHGTLRTDHHALHTGLEDVAQFGVYDVDLWKVN